MTTIQDPILSPMVRKLRRDMLKWHCGQAMFCPGCQRILDCKRAVELDFYGNGNSVADGGDLRASKVMCVQCYDFKCSGGKLEAQLRDTGFRVEVIDGRKLFGKGRKS